MFQLWECLLWFNQGAYKNFKYYVPFSDTLRICNWSQYTKLWSCQSKPSWWCMLVYSWQSSSQQRSLRESIKTIAAMRLVTSRPDLTSSLPISICSKEAIPFWGMYHPAVSLNPDTYHPTSRPNPFAASIHFATSSSEIVLGCPAICIVLPNSESIALILSVAVFLKVDLVGLYYDILWYGLFGGESSNGH